MKNTWLFIILCVSSTTSVASDFCKKLPINPGFPSGLGGQYEVIGRDPNTGSAYTGKLSVSYGKSSYALTRTVQGKTINGEAWAEQCGMDKILGFHARYYTKPVTEIGCRLGNDADNYNRLTCRTRQGGKNWPGLESWFQTH